MPIKIFCCYAHEDEPLLNELKAHLRPLEHQGFIDIWYDRNISAGAEWKQEISNNLNDAQIILLLVSPDFMNSDYCYGTEMKQALERQKQGDVCVIPVILRPTDWQATPFDGLQALPKDAIPVAIWQNRDAAFLDIAKGIRKAVKDFLISSQDKFNPNSDMFGKPPNYTKFYYCYISEAKVDQILSQNAPNTFDDVIAASQRFKEGKGKLSASIDEFLENGGEFGKPETLRYAQERSKTLVTKLLAAQQFLENKYENCPWLMETIQKGQHITPGAFLYYGEFAAARYDEEFAYLESSLPSKMVLKLSCSLKYFSDVWNDRGEFVPHSGNVMFFSGEVSAMFLSLLYVLQVKNDRIFGTPIFLGLPIESPLQL